MKTTISLLLIFQLFFFASCNSEESFEDNLMTKATWAIGPSSPTSSAGIIPHIIAGENRGGNRTCSEVANAFSNIMGHPAIFDFCTQKFDYGDFNDDGISDFNGEFPQGLDVEITDLHLSFKSDGCITIDNKKYIVGAVIIKGSNAANVYFYPNGIFEDSGLAAPGGRHMISNVSFCLLECKESVVIALKSWYWLSYNSYVNNVWADLCATYSSGVHIYPPSGNWCNDMGVMLYPEVSYAPLFDNVGSIEITEALIDGKKSLIITIDLNEGLVFHSSYLYVGSLNGLGELSTCPLYKMWPYQLFNKENSHVFVVPLEN